MPNGPFRVGRAQKEVTQEYSLLYIFFLSFLPPQHGVLKGQLWSQRAQYTVGTNAPWEPTVLAWALNSSRAKSHIIFGRFRKLFKFI